MKASAFSLIELVVVIAIIAMLTTIAVPFYGKYVTRSRVALAALVLTDLNSKAMALYNEGKIAPGMTALLMGGITWEDNSSTPYDHYPVTAATMFFPGDGIISDNAWMFCVDVADLNFTGYSGTAGSRLCSKVVVNGGIFKTYCGSFDQNSALEIPVEFLPDECNLPNVSAY